MRIVARLLKNGLHLGELLLEFRTRLCVRRTLRLRGLPCLRHRTLRGPEPLLQVIRNGTQRRLLIARPARGFGHRLLKLRDATLDLRLFLQERGPLLIRGSRGLGKRLLARRDLRVCGGEFLADLFQLRRKCVLRLVVPRLQTCKLLTLRSLLRGELRFELLAAQIHLGELARRVRDLGHERLARGIQRTGEMLVMGARLGELAHDGIQLLARGVALGSQRRDILPGRFFKLGKFNRHALHLRLRLVTLTRDVVELAAQSRELALHLPHLLLQPLGSLALLGKIGERPLAFGTDARELRLGLLLRSRRLFLRVARGRDLAAELVHLRLEDRIRQQPLRAGCDTRVLLFEILECTLGLRELPRDVLARLERRGVLGLYLCRDLLAPRDLAVEADIDGLRLLAQPVALDDERIDLPLERGTLLAQLASELLPLLEHRLALAAELHLLLRLLRLDRIELLAQHRHIAARAAAALDRRLKFADLGILRLRELIERCDARGGFCNSFLRLGAFLFPLAGKPGLRLDLLLDLTRGPVFFRTGLIALVQEHLEAFPIIFDFRFQPLHHRRVMRDGIPNARKPDFELRGAQPGSIEIDIHGLVVRLERVHLHLEILQRLAHVGLAVLDAELDLLPHLLLRGLHVSRGLDLQLVRAGQEFLRLRSRLLLPREFQRRFLLRLLHGFDPAVQLVHHPLGIPLAAAPGDPGRRRGAGCLGDVFKFRDLSLQAFDLLVLCVEFRAHLLALLVRPTGEISADGDSRVALRDLVHRVVHVLAQLLHLLGGSLMRLGQRLPLLLQLHDLTLVIATHHRDAALHVGREIGKLDVHLRRNSSPRGRHGCFLRDAQRRFRQPASLRCRHPRRTCA